MYRHTRIAHAASSKTSLRGRQARRRPPPRPIWRLSDALWTAIAIALPAAATWLSRTQAVDLAYQVRAGGLMLDTHHLLSTDLFTFTVAGHTWLNQQWAAEVFFAAIWRAGGWGGDPRSNPRDSPWGRSRSSYSLQAAPPAQAP